MISKSVFIKKKRIMEQFSLEKYLANPSRKVVTRKGRNIRIVCTDKRDLNFPIVALIERELGEGEGEVIYAHTKDGKYHTACSDILDLFFAPEKHEGWVNLYKWANKDCAYYTGGIFNSKAEAENKRDTSDLYVATIKIEWEE